MELGGGGTWASEHSQRQMRVFSRIFVTLESQTGPLSTWWDWEGVCAAGEQREGHVAALGGPPHINRVATGHVAGGEGLPHGGHAAGGSICKKKFMG